MMRFACLRLPRWPVQRLHAERPELRRGPLLLCQRDARGGERIAACCLLAERCGVRRDMPVAEATTLFGSAERPSVAIVPYDSAADTAALGRLADWCKRFSPAVGWNTLSPRGGPPDWYGPAPDHLFLDARGLAHLFGGEEAYTRQIIAEFAQRGLHIQLGLGCTIGAAWALTAAEPTPAIMLSQDDCAALWSLNVDTLRLAPEILDTLARLGVIAIEQLVLLPRDGLAERFGPLIGLRLDQLFGHAAEVIVQHNPPPRYEAVLRLESPTDRREVLDWLLGELIARVTAELREHGMGAVRLTGQLWCESSKPATFGIGLFQPSHDARQWQSLLQLQFERLTLSGLVERMWLRADSVAPMERQQGELFADAAAIDEPALTALANRLSSRLGSEAVVRPLRQASALPEAAFRYAPLVGLRRQRTGAFAAARYRPLRLFAPPVRLDGTPAAFRWRRQEHLASRCCGPERIETHWWRRMVRRDYYRVETTAGHRFWLFQDLHDGAWYLHGSFE